MSVHCCRKDSPLHFSSHNIVYNDPTRFSRWGRCGFEKVHPPLKCRTRFLWRDGWPHGFKDRMPSLAMSSCGACWVQFSPFINILCGTLVVSKPARYATDAAVAGCCSSTPLLQYQRQCLAATVTLPAVTRCTKCSLTTYRNNVPLRGPADSLFIATVRSFSLWLDSFPSFFQLLSDSGTYSVILYMPCTVWPRTSLAFDFLIISEFFWEAISFDCGT